MDDLRDLNENIIDENVAISLRPQTIDDFVGLVIKALTGKSNIKIYLKLVGRNVNGVRYAALPNACVLGKDATDETKPSALNFVSLDKSNLQFSNYEMSQMNKGAKPSNMDKETSEETNSELDDLDV